MATIDLTLGNPAQEAHVAEHTTKRPYSVERVVDLAVALASKGSALATGDVIQVFDVPKNTLLHGAIAKVEAVTEATGATFDLDVAGGDDFIDGATLTTVGWCAVGSNGLAPFGANTVLPVLTSDTIDMTLYLGGAGTAISTGKIRVIAFMTDVSELAGPDEVTRDQLA